jgi:pimeloyl-ACP methyl ester carboxylesterase
MATLTRDGVDINFEVHGQGPVVLLTHGYLDTSEMWHGQIEALAHDHTLILWDIRGHGRSASPDDPSLYSQQATIDDMGALLDEVGAQTATLGGLSLGGYLSLAFRRDHVDRVDGLLIIATGPGFRNDEARQGWNDMTEQLASGMEEKGFAGQRLMPAAEAQSRHGTAKGLIHAARGILPQRDASVMDSLASINVPTLVLAGAKDQQFAKATDYMAARISAAEKVVIGNAGHSVNVHQRDAFNEAVGRFLRAHNL